MINKLIRYFLIIIIFHLFLSLFYKIIFENHNYDIKKINFIVANKNQIQNLIIGDSTGMFGLSNWILMKDLTFNFSMYAENIVCNYYKLKFIKQKTNMEFNIYINAQDYIFNRNDFCNNKTLLRNNVILLGDYIDYFYKNNYLTLNETKNKYYKDKFISILYLDIYDFNNLKLISNIINQYLYNLLRKDKIRFIKTLDINLDQLELFNLERAKFKSNEEYFVFHSNDDKSYKIQQFDKVVYDYIFKISELFGNKKIYSYIMPHYQWNRDQKFHKKLTKINNYEMHYDFQNLYNNNIEYFYNSSHLNKIGSDIFSIYFSKYIRNNINK